VPFHYRYIKLHVDLFISFKKAIESAKIPHVRWSTGRVTSGEIRHQIRHLHRSHPSSYDDLPSVPSFPNQILAEDHPSELIPVPAQP